MKLTNYNYQTIFLRRAENNTSVLFRPEHDFVIDILDICYFLMP